MNRFFTLLLMIFSFEVCSAQNTSDIGKILLSIIVPDNTDFSENQQISINTKISQIITAEGMIAANNSNFSIIPRVSLQNTEVVEGGMRNINVVWLDLNLSIQENMTGLLFSSYSSTIKGSGVNQEKAISDAINKIDIKSKDFKKFITTAKDKIINYYKEKCSSIIAKSETFAKQNKYEESLALLMSVPEAVSECYSLAQKKSLQIYAKYQEKNCKEDIQKAKAMIANTDYEHALHVLMSIDSSTSCFKEAKSQISIIENKIKAEDTKKWNFMMQQYKDNVSLEKLRINAIKEIASSYYKAKSEKSNIYIIK